jgi:hypothetical protein
MSVLFVVYGFSPEYKESLKDFIPKHELEAGNLQALSVSTWRCVEHYAKTLGIEPFSNGRYKVWIHPCGLSDILNDTALNEILDVTRQADDHVCVRIGLTDFIQTTTVRAAYLFGANSNLSDFKYFFQGLT